MKNIGNRGFVLMETCLLMFLFLILLVSMFSAAGFRNRAEILRVKKLEASYAANAVVELMITEVLKDGTCSLEDGVERMEREMVFEPDDGSEEIRIPVAIWTERKGQGLHLFASAAVGNVSKTSSAELYF